MVQVVIVVDAPTNASVSSLKKMMKKNITDNEWGLCEGKGLEALNFKHSTND